MDRKPKLIKSRQSKKLNLAGAQIDVKLSSKDAGGEVFVIEGIDPVGGGIPVHTHTYEDETFYVQEGEAEITFGDEVFIAKPGDMACLPREIKHRIKIVGSQPARVLNVVAPGETLRSVW